MADQRLWAPWRLEYIKATKTGACIFCEKLATGDDEAALIAHRGRRCFVILNAFPYNNGHVMVAPYEHISALEGLDPESSTEMMELVQLSLRAIASAYGPDGYNVGLNQGKIAGAGVEGHVHIHVVPRWTGDTNFMPVVAETRVLPEELGATWRSLRASFAELAASDASANTS
jgi:ATP adenylyltransferase